MGQYTRSASKLLAAATLLLSAMTGCDKPAVVPATAPSTRPTTAATVASVVPAATDMILQMGCRPQLVGVSNYDPKIPELDGIARVGDYLTIDWEKLTQIRPSILVIARPKEEFSAVFAERAAKIGMTLLPVHSDRLSDITSMIRQIADSIGQSQKGNDLVKHMQHRLDAVATRVAPKPKVRTLILLDEAGQFVVGPNNFLDDLLTLAGGANVAAHLAKDYPTIDREKLLELSPDAVIVLMPDAPTQVVDAARRFWTTLPQLPAVRDGKVFVHSEPFLLLPTAKVADTAEILAKDLHP